jgi:hypothetical protein
MVRLLTASRQDALCRIDEQADLAGDTEFAVVCRERRGLGRWIAWVPRRGHGSRGSHRQPDPITPKPAVQNRRWGGAAE